MKKYFFSFAAVIMLLSVCSCNKDAIMDAPSNATTRADEKPGNIDFAELDTTYFVSDKDVEAYIHFKKLVAKSEKRELEVREVVPLGLNDEATLAYLINYNEGWEIITADKRAQRVLATDDKGSLSLKEAPEAVVAWIENLEMQILSLRSCAARPEWASDEAWGKMQESIDFWRAINAEGDFVMEHIGDTRGSGDNPPIVPNTINAAVIINPMIGHWELSNVIQNTDTVASDHLITTHWHQSGDYNRYCPSKTVGTGNAPAGCGPVAVAQMEYFLHNKIGKPLLCPSEIYCSANTSNVEFGVNMYISNTSSTLWSSMGSDTDAAAKLIAGCGIKQEVEYGNTETSTTSTKIYNNLTADGLLFNYYMYSDNIIKQSLTNGMPILIEASGTSGYTPIGHAFIIDRYKGIADIYTYCYEWVVDEPGNGTSMHPLYKEEIEIDYESTEITQFGMNWGWTSSSYDNMWFASAPRWVIDNTLYFYTNGLAAIYHNFR